MYYDQIKLLQQGVQKARGLLGDKLDLVPVFGGLNQGLMAAENAGRGNYAAAAENLSNIIPAGKIASRAIRALTKGRSAGELGGLLGATKYETDADRRMAIAQRNAALPVEQGGLGLPADNTPMMRAKAMGFDVDKPLYHGTEKDISAFDPSLADTRRNTGTPSGSVVVSSNPITASSYAGEATDSFQGLPSGYSEGGNVMPLVMRDNNGMSVNAKGSNWNNLYLTKYPEAETTNDIAAIAKERKKQSATIRNVLDNATWAGRERNKERVGDSTFVFDPSLLRSRFAAFDPMRRNEADLLAMTGQSSGNINPFNFNQLVGLLGSED